MPALEPLPPGVVESSHIGLGVQQCAWLLVAITVEPPGALRRLRVPPRGL